MENRFGLKDLLVVVLLLAVLVTVWFGIIERDRRWEQIQTIKNQVQALNDTTLAIQDQIRSGVIASSAETKPSAGLEEVPAFREAFRVQEAPDYAEGGVFVGAFKNALNKLTPIVEADYYQRIPESYVIESLIARNPKTLELEPFIAKSWEISEDGLTYTFEMREDAVFSDGEPLTSEDVVFTFEQIIDPSINSPSLKSYYEIVDSVEAQGPYRVEFKLSEPYFQGLLFTGGMAILPKHYYEQFSPDEFNTKLGLLVGSGPYMLEGDPAAWTSGGDLVLVRNNRYWGPKPALERLVFKVITEPTAEKLAYLNGEIDMYEIPRTDYKQLAADEDFLARGPIEKVNKIDGGYSFLGWNLKRDGQDTLFADKRVRQAMTMLTDRQTILSQIMNNLGRISNGPFHPDVGQANPDIQPWPYDPDRAIALLKEAGFEDRDGDGVIESADGKPFRFKLMHGVGSPTTKQIVFFLRDAYARAGIAMEPDPTEWNTVMQRVDERNFDAITMGWGGALEMDPKQIYHSESMAGGSNFTSFSTEALDDLIDVARVTVDADERLQMWHQIHAIMHDEQPYTFLFHRIIPTAVDQRFKNVESIGWSTNKGLNMLNEWYVPTADRRYGP